MSMIAKKDMTDYNSIYRSPLKYTIQVIIITSNIAIFYTLTIP